jgi:predicted nucleic acid-binding protein
MISCKYIPFLQDFVNLKSFLPEIKVKELLKEGIKGVDVNEGKFILNIDVLFAL